MPAAKVKVRRGEAAEPIAPADGLYEHDFYGWTQVQAAALRSGRTAALDIAHLADETEDLGKEQFAKLRRSFRVVLLPMLKWDHQPERRSRSWAISIEKHRLDLDDVLDENPFLRRRRAEAVERAYRRARLEAAEETGLSRAVFPHDCPYTLEDIVERPFAWPEA